MLVGPQGTGGDQVREQTEQLKPVLDRMASLTEAIKDSQKETAELTKQMINWTKKITALTLGIYTFTAVMVVVSVISFLAK